MGSKFLERLHEEDDGNSYYTAEFSFGEDKAVDPDGELSATFTAQVPPGVLDLSQEHLIMFLKGWDLKKRTEAKKEHDNYQGSSTQNLSEEEKEKKRQEFSEKMSHRHEAGSAIEKVEEKLGRKLEPQEIQDLLEGEKTIADLQA